jgi:hypothetical protein
MCAHISKLSVEKKGGLSIQHVYSNNTLTKSRRSCVMAENKKVRGETRGFQASVGRSPSADAGYPNSSNASR